MITPYALLILQKDNKVLLLKRSAQASFGPGKYCLIGGKAEDNESMVQAIIREAHEEVGITVLPDQLKFAHVFHRKGPTNQLVATCFVSHDWQGELVNSEPTKHDEYVWFNINQLPDDMLPAHKQAIEAYAQGNYYSEHGW